MRRITTLGPVQLTPWVFHADVVRAHVANRCLACHPSDYHLCTQARSLPEVAA